MSKAQPELLWAQRKDKLYLTVDLQDCKSPDVKISNPEETSGRFEFTGNAAGHDYELVVDLMHPVKADEAKIQYSARNIFVVLPKKEEGDHWPRLTKEKGKQTHIKVDWSKYIDQDDEESGADAYAPDLDGMSGLGGMGAGGMGGMPGMGGMGGMGMGGMGGAGGMGGMDMAQLQAMMAAQGGMGGGGEGQEENEDSDDEDLPDLEA